MGRCAAAVDDCKGAAAMLRMCVQSATAHVDRCCALLRAAGAMVAALDQALNACELDGAQLRQLHAICAAAMAATDLAIMRVKVGGRSAACRVGNDWPS